MTELPATQHAIQFTGPGEIVHNRGQARAGPGSAPSWCSRSRRRGICFSDTKLLHALDRATRGRARSWAGSRPRSSRRSRPTSRARRRCVPGHECCARIVAVGRRRPPPRGRRAGPRPDRLPPPAHRRLERGVRLQLRGRPPGVRPPRRADDPGPGHRRAVPDPRGGGAVGLGRGAARAVGVRREVVRHAGAADAARGRPPAGRAWTPGARLEGVDERSCRRPRRA